MKTSLCVAFVTVFVSQVVFLANAFEVDLETRPEDTVYERAENRYLGKFTLGEVVEDQNALQCSELCDVQERCMGFNFYKNNGKCELLSHNQYTTPVTRKTYGHSSRIDHYTRIASEYQCPENSFRHPYKPRCYMVFNGKRTYYEARRHCRNGFYGELAVIPNRMEHIALFDEIQSRLNGDAWIGMWFKRSLGFIIREGQMSPFLWLENLENGLPPNANKQYGGVLVKQGGKFDYITTAEERSYVCEIRSHMDNELNELCPFDTALFDDNCYWSNGDALPASEADAVCAVRGGHLAAFPTQDAIEFTGEAWNHIIESGDDEVWIGIEYDDTDDVWTWFDGADDKHPAFWNSSAEQNEGELEPCGSAGVSGDELSWFSRDCDEEKEFLCMGASGATKSNECTDDDPLVCPDHSSCVEGYLIAKCVCDSGYTAVRQDGDFACLDRAVCQAFGDPHYEVFDGGRVTYQGKCRHLLAGPCPGDVPDGMPNFQIIVFNDVQPGFNQRVTFTIFVEVEIYNKVVKLGPGDAVLVDGHARTPEFTISLSNGKYIHVTSTPNGLRLTTDFGLSVDFKRRTLTVSIPNDYVNVMCGICGNFNGDPADDLLHNQAQWMLQDDQGNANCSTDDPYEEPECDPAIVDYAEERCGLIKNLTVLNTCRLADGFDMDSYYDDCMEDACAIGTEGGIDQVLCDTMAALQAACDAIGYPISNEYRFDTDCPYDCIPHSTYNPEMSLDVPTCQNPDAIYDISNGIGEGCECDDGYILDGGECTPTDNCGCLDDNNVYMEVGEIVVNDECTEEFKCRAGNNIVNTPIECIEDTVCVLGETSGIYECQCAPHYEGDPDVECHHEDACPYPMPDSLPASPDMGSMQTALRVNSLHVNDVVIDPNRPTSTLWIDPDTWVINPYCQNVTCFLGEGYDVSDTACVANADCVAGGDDGFECVCEPGYQGDGYVLCEEMSVTGDPHFLVTSHSSGLHLCYDAHGYNKEKWNILTDELNGVAITGELFETRDSTKDHPQSFFSNITVATKNLHIVFSQTDIKFGAHPTYQWTDRVDTEHLVSDDSDVFVVIVNDGIKLMVTKNYGKQIGHYLGVFIVESTGLSDHTSGIMGQFLRAEFDVEDITTDNAMTQGIMKFKADHPAVPVVLTQRYNRMHHSLVDCWLYRASYHDDKLLGSLSDYAITESSEKL